MVTPCFSVPVHLVKAYSLKPRITPTIWEMLDCGVANYEWLTKFPTGRVRHLNCFTSDHCLILLSLDDNEEHQKWRRKPFHFEAMWVSDSGCRDIITKKWDCIPDGTQSGDQNTKFFHRSATQRKRNNFIKGLRDVNGVWKEDGVLYITFHFLESTWFKVYFGWSSSHGNRWDDGRSCTALYY